MTDEQRLQEIRERQKWRANASLQNGRTPESNNTYADTDFLLSLVDSQVAEDRRYSVLAASNKAARELQEASLLWSGEAMEELGGEPFDTARQLADVVDIIHRNLCPSVSATSSEGDRILAREVVCDWRDEWQIPTPEGDQLDCQEDLITRVAAVITAKGEAGLFEDCRQHNHQECLFQWPDPSGGVNEHQQPYLITCTCPCHSQIDAATLMRSACIEKVKERLHDPSLRFADEGIKAAVTDWTNMIIKILASVTIQEQEKQS